MTAPCAGAASPGKRSANRVVTAQCAWASCPGKGVSVKSGLDASFPWLKIRSDALWLHPSYMVKIQLDAILAPTQLKVHDTKLVDALWLHLVHGKIDMDANRLHITICVLATATPARSYHASKKIKDSHATVMKKDHAWVSIKSKKQSYVQMRLYKKNKTLTTYCIFSPLARHAYHVTCH
jgi:hypothetical protein